MTTVAILLFADVEELDFAGPWEVFRVAQSEDPTFDVFTVAEHLDPITCANGLRVLADRALADAGQPDVILVPGGRGTRNTGPKIAAWIAEADRTTTWTTSVCTGSFLLADAGVTAGKRVTTYHSQIENLRARGDTGPVLAGERWVHDGKVVTAAGVSAGIDMSLWLLGELRSPAFSRRVRDWIEYDPAPPY
jgi:transcriptional regulator GlxA family with amidase domain